MILALIFIKIRTYVLNHRPIATNLLLNHWLILPILRLINLFFHFFSFNQTHEYSQPKAVIPSSQA